LIGNLNFFSKIILADKPLDYTSADIVHIFKKNFRINKIGHAGTLDPKATGLLILCTDKMTKAIDKFMNLEKEYSGILRIGAVTKTSDTESEEENPVDVSQITDADIENVRKRFEGETEQIPPMHSAVKYKGKPLYKLARKGKVIERQPKKVFIKDFTVNRLNETEIYFKLTCSKGTYIRVLASDFGESLGVGAYLKSLRRLRIGEFTTENLTEEINHIKYIII
jgi:tRNA pseudouridine55 synthase